MPYETDIRVSFSRNFITVDHLDRLQYVIVGQNINCLLKINFQTSSAPKQRLALTN